MIIRPRSFPHPVLAPFRDDVLPNDFLVAATVSSDQDWFYLDVGMTYANDTLTGLIADGKAIHAIHVECRQNYFRTLYQLETAEARVTIPASQLRGRVEVCGFVLAQQPLGAYRIAGAHADYGEMAFDIRVGDVLAVGETLTFDAYVDYDPLKTLASILRIVASDDIEEGPMVVATGEEQIVVTLSIADYKRYTDLRGDPSLAPLLANQVVIPALLAAIQEMKLTPEDDHEVEMEKRWFRSVHRKLAELQVNLADTTALDAVQRLLQFPLRRSLEGLLHMTAEDVN